MSCRAACGRRQCHLLLLVFVVICCCCRPAAAGTANPWSSVRSFLDGAGIDGSGFFDLRAGRRLVDPVHEKHTSLAEARLQVELNADFGWGLVKFKNDFLVDPVVDDYLAEVRELSLIFSPLDFVDVKLGRQVLTWGTGDLLFVNDLFPKDWKSFFCGRDTEYLKAPADAVKVSVFLDLVNLDLVYLPLFNGSDYIDGNRLSYWNPLLGRTAGRDHVFHDEDRDAFFDDDEWAVRLYRTINGIEAAFYAYDGYWKTPEGFNPRSGRLIYPRLRVYGASVRSDLLGGLGNVEAGYYDSLDDRQGNDPYVRNSEWRFLAGFEHELGRDFTGGLQYYLEYMDDYADYQRTLPAGMAGKDRSHSIFTLRLTKLLLNQNLTLSCFAYYSPTDEDCYLRPKASYKINDYWLIEGGINLFLGEDDDTFFGQLEDNSNAFLATRVSF